jgi:hypothetical protein
VNNEKESGGIDSGWQKAGLAIGEMSGSGVTELGKGTEKDQSRHNQSNNVKQSSNRL